MRASGYPRRMHPSDPGHRPLDTEELRQALLTLRGWRHEDDTLVRVYEHRTFRDAIAFIVRLSFEAEQAGHHPELFNVYGRVEVRLRTHDAGNRVTALDVALAAAIDQLSRSS
jgi:4a-hydroxytetrahydrobiopterin dehydratase